MNKQIIISSDGSNQINEITDWLDFMSIDYQSQSLWNTECKKFQLPHTLEHCILIFNQETFRHMVTRDSDAEDLANFCKRHNQIWVIGIDISASLCDSRYAEKIKSIDCQLPKNGIVLILDAMPSDRCYLSHLNNIQITWLDYHYLLRARPRVQSRTLYKQAAQYDFLLTTILRKSKPERAQLWKELKKRPELLKRGLVSCKSKNDFREWLGSANPGTDMISKKIHASMDLYSNCWMELVPEGQYKDTYYTTEKIQKPIITKTPFVVISAAGYLDFLHSLGFRTFGHLIDESYANHYRVQDRISHALNRIEDIINNGTKAFYLASQDVLDHNFQRACEIAGQWSFVFDQLLWQLLDRANNYKPA